jgi:hypothetical protein
MTVPELCVYTHNFFDRADDPVAGEFAFEPDTVPAGVVPGQYFLVCGSIFNDGIHKAGDGDLTAETFTGTVQPMRVPPDFVALAEKIDAYDKALPSGGVYVSQSFAGWSGTMATGADGLPADGKTRYKSEINHWRKM